jgi:hypothetical protein
LTRLDRPPFLQYDWRLPPHQLEIRDRYFTNLKQSIQDMSKDYGPVVLVGHSMGNRVIQYFLNWVMQNDRYGRKWIDDNGKQLRFNLRSFFVLSSLFFLSISFFALSSSFFV